MRSNIIPLVIASLLAACAEHEEDLTVSEKKVTLFAEAYFNYDLSRAAEFVTPESRRWLQFAASNVTEADVDVLNRRSVPAQIEIDELQPLNDTTVEAHVTVDGYVCADTIGRPAVVTDNPATFRLTVVKREGHWAVRMAGPLRSEKRSRD